MTKPKKVTKRRRKPVRLSDWLGEEERCELVAWLKNREQYIATGIEDFGELKNAFKAIFRRDPSELYDHEK